MKLNAWLLGLNAVFVMSCASPNVSDVPSAQQRDIVHVSVNETGEHLAASKAPLVRNAEADGVLADQAGCDNLVSSSPLFEDAQAQNAWNDYDNQRYSQAASRFEKLSEDNSRTDIERQQLIFMAAMAIYKNSPDKDGAAAAAAMLKRAYGYDTALKRASAVYGTKLGYESAQWSDIITFTESLMASEEYRTYRSIALTNLGQYEAASSEFDRIEKFPKNLRLDALEARARAQSETSQIKASLETYRRIYEIDPKSEQGQIAQEAIMSQKDKWPKGFVFPRDTQKADKSKSAREIAEGHFNAHRSEKAISSYQKLLKDDKAHNDKAHVCEDLYAIARSYVKLRSHSKSLPIFKEALEACDNSDTHVKVLYSAAKAAWNAGENDQALAWYQSIIDDYSKHSYADDAYQYQAQILTSQGKLEEARQKLRDQIKAYPDGDMAKDAYWMLLSDLYDRRQYKDAVEFVNENIEHAGESDLYSQGRLKYFQGRAYEHLNNQPAAVQNYLRILDEYPLSYYAMLSLGRLQAVDKTQAGLWIETYRAAIYKPEQAQDYCFQYINHETSFKAAKLLTKMGLYDDALEEIDDLMGSTDAHESYEAKLARSMLLQKAGKYSDSARLAAGLLKPAQDLVNKAYAAWILAYPKPWHDIVSKAAEPESALYYTSYAIMREESYYNPRAESWANARGLMQLMLPTAQSSAAEIGMAKPSASDLFKPEIGIPIGSAYIAKLNKILVPHPMFVLPGYNAGQGNVGKWMRRFADMDVDVYVEKIPFKEARHYAKRVGTTLWRYRWLYDKDMPSIFDPGKKVGELSNK